MNKEREVKSSAYCHALEESLSWGQNQTLTYPKPFAFARPPPLLLHLSQVNLIQKKRKTGCLHALIVGIWAVKL